MQMITLSLLQEHVHNTVANAINSSVEHFVSPFLERAADVLDEASHVIERLPSTLLDKAFSKSLDVVTPFERMARCAWDVLCTIKCSNIEQACIASDVLAWCPEHLMCTVQKGTASQLPRSCHGYCIC